MSRLLRVPLQPLSPGEVVLADATARYVSRVHRLREGDRFVAFDPEAGLEADAQLLSTDGPVRCRVGVPRPGAHVTRSGLTLLQVLGKGDKPGDVIRAATALGTDRVLLLESARAVVRVPEERSESRRARFRSTAIDAARQCGRGDVPAVEGPLAFDDALALVSPGTARRVVLLPDSPLGLLGALAGWKRGAPLHLLVGPEGGLEPGEERRALDAGFAAASLGALVLRTEIAAVAALGVVAAFAAEPR